MSPEVTPTAANDKSFSSVNVGFALLWLGFSLYAFLWAPPAQPDTFDLIIQLSSGQWSDINPAIVALFNLMGIWPIVYACLALIDGMGQKVAAWPFVVGSFGLGAFALLLYLALRKPNRSFAGEKTTLIALLDSVWLGRAILLGSVVLMAYGVLNGDWSDFAQQWRSSQFIHVMSLDFCMLSAIVNPLLKEDMAKRGMTNSALFWVATLVPLLGIAFYLSVRSPLVSAAD